YVLISGELAIVTPDGTRVATVKPVTTVGEMGRLAARHLLRADADVILLSRTRAGRYGTAAASRAYCKWN
ncbi:MAG TPA: hypothetical protein EYO94_06260, partial [Acidobacteria bacterium]|nr:hypothetical protein [Acidobacteriota bacterium]